MERNGPQAIDVLFEGHDRHEFFHRFVAGATKFENIQNPIAGWCEAFPIHEGIQVFGPECQDLRQVGCNNLRDSQAARERTVLSTGNTDLGLQFILFDAAKPAERD